MDGRSGTESFKEVEMTVLAPHIRKQVTTLLQAKDIILGYKPIEIMNPMSSCPNSENENCDRFHLIIPYAATPLECIVVFQASSPECPPDFVFTDTRFFLPFHEMQSYVSWDIKDPNALTNTVKDIVGLYKKKNIEFLQDYNALNLEYLSFYQLTDFEEADIEIFIPAIREHAVHFLIRLHVNLHSYFDELYTEGYEVERNPLLLVIFPNRNSNICHQRLYVTKNMEMLIDIKDSLKTKPPEFSGLTRHFLSIQTTLKTQCEMSASRYHKRKLYFTQFLAHFKSSLVEYDVLFFTNMVLLLKDGEFYFMVEIKLSKNFPNDTPTITFRSIYHTHHGKPITVSFNKYSYSPHWPIKKILQNTVVFIKDYAKIFKEASMKPE